MSDEDIFLRQKHFQHLNQMQANNSENDVDREIISMSLTLKDLMKTARNYVYRDGRKNETSLTVNTLHLYRESEKTTNSVELERMNFSLWLF